MEFCASYGDYQFVIGSNDFDATRADAARLMAAAEKSGRDVGVYALYFVITGETDAEAEAKWQHYKDGADLDAIAFMTGQASLDTSGATAETITALQSAFNLNIGAIVGSHATVADKLKEVDSMPGVKGVMCVFDDYVAATEDFGQKVMPLVNG
jgi:pyrimidine oxygenase